MASTTALYTGLSGLTAHARALDVIGNNIANVNTTAFKGSRVLFSNVFSRTVSDGSAPAETRGGTNPLQIGLGVNVAGTQRDFSVGSVNETGRPADLAIEGDGFFIVRRGDETFYTRAGAFDLDSGQQLVTIDGDRVQGFGVDAGFNIMPGALTDLTIPIGELAIAEATSLVRVTGNLNAGGGLPTNGTELRIGGGSGTMPTGFSLIAGATVPPGAGNVLEITSLLAEIEDPALPGSGTSLFAPGQIIELNGAQRGTSTLPSARLTIAAGSTVQDLMNFLRDGTGIDTSTGTNPNGSPPGLALDPATGLLTLVGNTGTVNDLTVDSEDIDLLDAGGTPIRSPFVSERLASADGESTRTQFIVYDSLGTPVPVDATFVLRTKGDTGTTWRYSVGSSAATGTPASVASGTISFDTAGQPIGAVPVPITIPRAGTGAATPLTFDLSFADGAGQLSALANDPSAVFARGDGSSFGVLVGFGVDRDGVIVGSFDNGEQRALGQVALATFTNPEGLVDEGSNLFRVGPASGPAAVTTPGAQGSGPMIGGALELSNVDLGQEFIKMIMASTGYTASSRVIRTTDELMQQLLVLGR